MLFRGKAQARESAPSKLLIRRFRVRFPGDPPQKRRSDAFRNWPPTSSTPLKPCSSAARAVEVPFIWNSLEAVSPPVLEAESRSRDQVLDGPRHEHLARVDHRNDTGSDVDGDPADCPVEELALAGVNPRPDLDPEIADTLHDRERAPDRASGPVERGKEPIACRVDFAPAVAL